MKEQTMAEKNDLISIRVHMAKIGYSETIDEGVYTFEHPEKVWIALNEENNGIMFTTAFKGAESYNPEDPTLLSIINMLNQETRVGLFVAMDEYTVYKAWYYGNYSPQNFQNYFELLESDIDLFLSGMEDEE
jgi:hypothetical protein